MVSRDTTGSGAIRNTSDPRQVKTSEDLYALRAVAERDILAKVLDTYEGRRVLYNILAKGDIYDQDGTMPYESEKVQRLLGRREMALELLKETLIIDPNVYILMQREAGEFETAFNINAGREEEENA